MPFMTSSDMIHHINTLTTCENNKGDDEIMRKKMTLIFILSLIFILPWQARAEEDEARQSDTVTLYLENDLFGSDNTDRHYTHGTKLSWISRDLSDYRDNPLIPAWSYPFIERLPYVNKPGCQRSVSLSLGQNIYTPDDTDRSDLIKDDRPYAGVTYMSFGLHSKNGYQMDSFEFGVGIVGRHSYAEDCQKIIHKWIDSPDPKGWNHQLHDEPILNIFLERKWRVLQMKYKHKLSSDCIPHIGCGIGNAFTGANVGTQVRFGWNLPNDFGTFIIRPGSDSNAPVKKDDPRFFRPIQRFGIHAFFAVDGNAIARNIFLDGNTFRDSHSVDKEHYVADFVGGIGIIIHRFKITYSYVYRTKEFKSQKFRQQYGAISMSYTF